MENNPSSPLAFLPRTGARPRARRFRGGLGVVLAGLATVVSAQPVEPVTYTYKTVGTLEIKADVYAPADASDPRPVVVFMHGGSLINGSRASIDDWTPLRGLLDAGIAVVSIDYRVAPETKLPEIIADIEDAFRWVREEGPAKFGADPARIGAAGGSAGGYLALVTGYRIHPRPRVVLTEMSYGDLIGEWQLRPSIHPPHHEDSNLTEEEAWQQVSGPPVASGRDRAGDGSAFNDFIRRTAQWPKTISGWDPRTEADKFLPYLPARNVTPGYPPTFLIHGMVDTDVPFTQPQQMAAEFARHGVRHRLFGIPNGEHGYRGADPATVAEARAEAVRFVVEHLTAPAASEDPPATVTFTYKTVGDLAIKADVHRARTGTAPAPVAVWIHGGGLMNGSRQRDSGAERQLMDRLLADGVTVVSIDYRLAPETKLPGIIADVEDAFRWVREEGPALFGADPERIAAVGTSAGGYLTLVAGYRVQPRPVALVSFWGYGDIIGPWYSQPSPHARHHTIRVSAEEAWQQVSGPPVANGDDRPAKAAAFYQYCRQHGLWPKAVSGWDPQEEAARFQPYLPVANVTAEYPPTLLIHGEADTDVPAEQSVMMAEKFRQHGVPHHLHLVPGAEHGLKGSDPAIIRALEREAAEFLRQHLFPSPARETSR